MVKKLRFGKVQLVERQGALLLVQFLDDSGELYDWAPKWADVEQIFLKAINIERFNKPESQFLNKFAETAKKVVEGAQKIETCEKIQGQFKSYENAKLCIQTGVKKAGFLQEEYAVVKYVTTGFEVSVSFLDEWLERKVEVLVINDIGIQIKDLNTYFVYPERLKSKDDELPF